MSRERQQVTLIGSGLTGPLLAISLVKRGLPCGCTSAGPTCAAYISARAVPSTWRFPRVAFMPFARPECGTTSSKIIIPMRGRMMHSVAGELTFMPYGKDETEVINSVSRADLNIALMNAAERAWRAHSLQ